MCWPKLGSGREVVVSLHFLGGACEEHYESKFAYDENDCLRSLNMKVIRKEMRQTWVDKREMMCESK